MSSLYEYLLYVCLRKMKYNQLSPFCIIYDGQEYLIIFNSTKYIIDNGISYNSTPNNHQKVIYANYDNLLHAKTDIMYPYYYKQLNIDYINWYILLINRHVK